MSVRLNIEDFLTSPSRYAPLSEMKKRLSDAYYLVNQFLRRMRQDITRSERRVYKKHLETLARLIHELEIRIATYRVRNER